MEHSPIKADEPSESDAEALLRGLLKGEYSSLRITFNDHHTCYTRTAAEAEAEGHEFEATEWVSEEERRKAIAEESVWCLQWYPDVPLGFYRIAASSLDALLAYVRDRA